VKTFKEWFRLREELWHTQGPERVNKKHPYHLTGQGAPSLGGGTGAVPPAGMLGQMRKKMRKKMKPS